MVIAFACPNCGKPFRVADDLAGRKTKCSACATALVVPGESPVAVQAPPPPPPPALAADANPFAFDDAPASSPPVRFGDLDSGPGVNGEPAGPVGDPDEWQGAHSGLRSLWFGTCLPLASALLVLVVGVIGAVLSGASSYSYSTLQGDSVLSSERTLSGFGQTAGVAIGFLMLALLAGTNLAGVVLRIVGLVRLQSAPPEAGARTAALLALLGEVGGMVALGVGYVMQLAAVAARHGPGGLLLALASLALELLGLALFVGGFIFLMVYLRKIGEALGSRVLPGRAMNVLVWCLVGPVALVVVVFVFSLAVGVAAQLLGRDAGAGLGLLGFLFVLVAAIGVPCTLILKYLNVLNLAAQEIRKRALRGLRA